MSNEKFHEAALRHFYDAECLYINERYDNSFCLYGFAVECALKMLANAIIKEDMSQYGHNVEKIKGDIAFGDILAEGAWIYDPSLQMRIDALQIPEKLYYNHPEHRYYGDYFFGKEDCDRVKSCVNRMVNMVAEALLNEGEMEGLFE